MSIKNKIKSKYLKFLVSTRNLINEQLKVSPYSEVDYIETGSPINTHYSEITNGFRKRLINLKIKELLKDVQFTYQFNNGRMNKEQLSLLLMYKRELNTIK